MKPESPAARADYLSRRRARILPGLFVIYMSQQAIYFSAAGTEPTSAQTVKIGAWAVLTIVITLALATKGFWFQTRQVREMIDDESTKANRLEAMRLGFLFAIFGALAAYFLNQFEPLTVREAIQLIVSLALGAALLRFALLERRAHSDA
jgi:hypothetical protein